MRRTVVLTIAVAVAFLSAGAFWIHAQRVPTIRTIAVIPQAGGPMRGELQRIGATTAAKAQNYHLYWNSPTSESDAAGQISLIEKVVRSKYHGLVLSPNHSLMILAPLRRALATGMPVVIVSAPLDLPASSKLAYVLNDDQKMGELAAAEIGRLVQGEGSVALLGLTRYAPGVTRRVRAAERLLATQFPRIRIVSRLSGAYDISHADELMNSALDANPELKAVLSFTANSTRGAHRALNGRALLKQIHLVGCEQDSDLIEYVQTGEIAALLAENTYQMGHDAVALLSRSRAGQPMPAQSVVPPLLLTKNNLGSTEAIPFTRLR